MIIIQIMGGLGNQIAQYAFGRCCAERLGVALKLDITAYRTYTLHAYGLDRFTVLADQATDEEIAAAKACGTVAEHSLLFDPAVAAQVRDGVYLSGYWGDYRYSQDGIDGLRQTFQPLEALDAASLAYLREIQRTESVSLHIRRGDYVTNPNCVLMPLSYYEDAVREVTRRIPEAHIYVFSDDLEWVEAHLRLDGRHTLVRGNDAGRNVDDWQLMRSCRHHVIANSSFSFWAARLGGAGGLTVAPLQYFGPTDPYLIQTFGRVAQPVWPADWRVLPMRRAIESVNPYLGIAGGNSSGKPIRVGVWNYYEELTTDGFIFRNTDAAIGHNLLKPWCDLYAYGQAHGMHFVTLDQVAGPQELDAVIFMDRPRTDSPMVARLLAAEIPKYLCLFETEIIKPDNWDATFHAQCERIFTWSDAHVDERRNIKLNFAIDPDSPYDFDVLKTAFHQRKLCTLIAGAKSSSHPNELYSERVRAIRWFESHAPGDFDLFGMGWDATLFPSYRGSVHDKLATLSHYRFAICYENARNYPGYITEKILDCFHAGVVPVYLGAPNIDRWIPRDCFIDRRSFRSEEELHAHLAAMDEESHGAYLDRIRDFLASPQVYPFTTECFITTLTSFIARDVKLRRGEAPDVSVAIPAYNYGRFVGTAVDSALAAGVDKLEVLILDNASTDETQEVLKRYAENPRVRVMRNTRNIGAPNNWNNAFRTAVGRYVTILSADDFMLPGHLSRMLDVLEANPPIALAYCPCIWVDAEGKQIQVMNHGGHAAGDYLGGRNELVELLRFDCYITPSAALIRRSVFDLVGKMDDSLHGALDWDLWIRIAEHVPDFAFFKTPSVCYRIHSAQDTVLQTSQAHLLVDHIDIVRKLIERGGLPVPHANAVDIVALLQSKFSAYPKQLVAHLEPAVRALEQILLSGLQAADLPSQPLQAVLPAPSGIATTASELPLVSVIVATFNRPQFLERCLQSIVAQTYRAFEIIVVNDGGTPVESIVARLNAGKNIHYIAHATNKGAAAARNSALRLAKGEFVAYLDDDDEYLPEHLERVISALRASHCRFGYSRAEYLIEHEHGGQVQIERQRPFFNAEYSRDLLMIANFIPTPTWVFERSLVDEVGYFDETFKAWEDWEWLLRASARTDFLSLPIITIEVHQRPNDSGHLGVQHRPEMRKWFERVYAKHPATTALLEAQRAEYMARLFNSGPAGGQAAAPGADDKLDIVGLVEKATQLSVEHPDEAIALYQTWLKDNTSPMRFAAAYNLASLLDAIGAHDEAVQAFRGCLSDKPDFVPARFGLSIKLEQRGEIQEAITHLRWICSPDRNLTGGDSNIRQLALGKLQRLELLGGSQPQSAT
jgi:glycosyltransferase involved in cell wall biosynthesis